MSQAGSESTRRVLEMLRAPTGLPFTVAASAERQGWTPGLAIEGQVIGQNIGHELAERTAGAGYPAFHVYCEKISNQQREKFRTFSGKVRMAVDVRVTQDQLDGIERQLELYVQAVTDVLEAHRGHWGQGMFYGGGYEASFGPVKHGGKNFVQSAKVTFDVDVSLK